MVEYRVPSIEHRASNIKYSVSRTEYRALCMEHRVLSISHQVARTAYQAWNIEHRLATIKSRVSCIDCQLSAAWASTYRLIAGGWLLLACGWCFLDVGSKRIFRIGSSLNHGVVRRTMLPAFGYAGSISVLPNALRCNAVWLLTTWVPYERGPLGTTQGVGIVSSIATVMYLLCKI